VELMACDTVALHLAEHGVGEFLHLLLRARSRGAFDPGIGIADVLLGYPRRMALDLKSEITLFEQHRSAVAAEERVAQPRFEAVPSGGKRAGEIADVLVVHAKHGAEPMLFYLLARGLGAVFF